MTRWETGRSPEWGERLEAAGLGGATLVAGTSVAHVFLGSSDETARAEGALRGLEGVAIYARDTLPHGLRFAHPQRTGDLVLLTAFGAGFHWAGAALQF